jgi:hypothetical protein
MPNWQGKWGAWQQGDYCRVQVQGCWSSWPSCLGFSETSIHVPKENQWLSMQLIKADWTCIITEQPGIYTKTCWSIDYQVGFWLIRGLKREDTNGQGQWSRSSEICLGWRAARCFFLRGLIDALAIHACSTVSACIQYRELWVAGVPRSLADCTVRTRSLKIFFPATSSSSRFCGK